MVCTNGNPNTSQLPDAFQLYPLVPNGTNLLIWDFQLKQAIYSPSIDWLVAQYQFFDGAVTASCVAHTTSFCGQSLFWSVLQVRVASWTYVLLHLAC